MSSPTIIDERNIDIVADRNVDYSNSYVFLLRDFTSFAYLMHLRNQRDNIVGSPLANLSANVSLSYAGTATVSAHIAAGRIDATIYKATNPATGNNYVATDNLLLSILGINIDVSVIQPLPFAQIPGNDAILYYDLLGSLGSASELILRGLFIVRAGVTIP